MRISVRRNIAAWGLYDFANSLVIINGAVYLSRWVVITKGAPDIWWGGTYAASTLLLLVASPLLGTYLDRRSRIRYLLLMAAGVIAAATWVIGQLDSWLSGNTAVVAGLCLFFLVNFFYQLSLVVFNTLLAEMKSAGYSKVSGIGESFNHMGSMAGLGLALVVLALTTRGGREASDLAVFGPSAVIFVVLATVAVLLLKEGERQILPAVEKWRPRRAIEKLIRELRSTGDLGSKRIGWYLIAFMLFADAVLTFQVYMSVYLERTMELGEQAKATVMLLALILAAVGALGGGWVGKKVDELHLVAHLFFGWAICLSLLSLWAVPGNTKFWIVFFLAGMLFGGTWTLVRSALVGICPPEYTGHTFGLFSVAQRAASILGPLVWGLIAGSPHRDRLALAVLALFVLAAWAVLRFLVVNRVNGDRRRRERIELLLRPTALNGRASAP